MTTTTQAPPRRFTVKVVGLTFVDDGRAYPDNVHRVREAHESRFAHFIDGRDDAAPYQAFFQIGYAAAALPEPLPIVLIRNPSNEHDTNAVEVHQPSVGGMLGHLPRDMAARVAPWLDAGNDLRVGVASVLVMPGQEDNPGVALCIERIDPEPEAA